MLHVITQKEFVKVTIKILDQNLKLAREQSKKHGQVANQVTVIFDMEGFNLKQYLWRPGKKLQVSSVYRDYSSTIFSQYSFLYYKRLFSII